MTLSIAATSVCDVCLEPFNTERRALCSIPCGHAFCFDCLKRVKPECPLCRTPFEWSGILRLHIDIEPPINASSPASSAGAPDSPSSVSSNPSPDVRARQLQEAIVTVANVGASEDRYRQLIAECRAFLKPLPKNSYQELRVSMRMMSYVYDIKNELHEMSKAKSALDVECARLHKDVARLTQKVADLEAVNREEKDQATAAQNTLQAKVDMMLQMMTNEFAQLRTMAQSTQPLPPENASMSEMLDATVAYSNPESLENERLLSAFMSPMPLLTPALARPMDDCGASSPALNLDLDAVGSESVVKCAAVGHPYSCHCVPCNVFADHEEAGQANPGPEETPTRPASRAPSRRASTKRMKSGLSLTAPGKDGEAQERPASSAAGRHGRMRSVTTVGYREGEAVAGGTDDTGDGNPTLRNRLHDLLNDPRSARNTPAVVSASMPVMSSMPTRTRPVVAHSSLSAIPDAPSPTREEAPSRNASAASSLLSSSSLRPQCLDEAPTEPTTATSHITSEHATPRRPSVVSHASKAALALEQTRRPSHHSSSGREGTTPFGREGASSFVREGTSSSGRESTEPTPEDHLRATQPIPIQSHSRKRSDAADCAFGPLRDYGPSEGSFGGASYRDGGGASYTGGASYSSRDNNGTYRDNGVTYRETTPDRDVFGSPPAEAPYYPSVSRKASLRRPSAAQSSGSSGSIRTHRDT